MNLNSFICVALLGAVSAKGEPLVAATASTNDRPAVAASASVAGKPDVAAAAVSAERKPFITALSMAYGRTHDDIDVYRFALRKDSGYQWLSNLTGWLSVYYEASANLWILRDDQVFAFALSPVFVYYFGRPGNLVRPYLEGGIGAAGLSKTDIGDSREFSTEFQFEDRLGAGFRIKDWDLCFRYMHYSNASIVQPNDGIDILMLALARQL